jgi:hypothetical protein
MGEDSLLERVTAAAEERQLSHNSLIAYRRTWLKIIAWTAAKASSWKPSQQKGTYHLATALQSRITQPLATPKAVAPAPVNPLHFARGFPLATA